LGNGVRGGVGSPPATPRLARGGFTEPSAFARRIKGMTADANVPPIDRPLPDDPRLLQEMVRELLATLRATQRRAEQLEQRLDRLLRRLYGPRSERGNPAHRLLFPEGAGEERNSSPPASSPEPARPSGPGRGHGRKRLPKDLPRRRVAHDVPRAERFCPCCGKERCRIGEEVSEQLDYAPASLFVVE